MNERTNPKISEKRVSTMKTAIWYLYQTATNDELRRYMQDVYLLLVMLEQEYPYEDITKFLRTGAVPKGLH
jgi:hypothetical protein